MWLAYLLAFAEEPHSLTRLGPWPDPQWKKAVKAGRAIRVISLNCAGGSAEAALETVRYKPDIVLLQESPSRHETNELARQLYKSDLGCVWGLDASILTDGTPLKAPLSPLKPFVAARVRLPTGIWVEVISLRLLPPSASIDLWSPRCWREHAENRRLRRGQVRDMMEFVKTRPRGLPLIIGGDFNAPAGDAVFRLLQPRLHDAFAEAGLGLGNTALNQFPFSRIDQIWIGDRFRAASVVTRETRHSDHRMVICDLLLRPRTGRTESRRRAR
jgi:endonuclease/exonuclease/phosphatase (EEP) superfamily protein YafD